MTCLPSRTATIRPSVRPSYMPPPLGAGPMESPAAAVACVAAHFSSAMGITAAPVPAHSGVSGAGRGGVV